MVYFLFLLFIFMFFFPNVLLYTISLLIISISLLVYLVSSNYMSTLALLLILVVYVGAMMVLIGYICAVSPNLIFSLFDFKMVYVLVFLSSCLSLNFESLNVEVTKSSAMIDYFFSPWGSFMFFLVIFMLFLTLLMVTSQYSSPQGPFRSV